MKKEIDIKNNELSPCSYIGYKTIYIGKEYMLKTNTGNNSTKLGSDNINIIKW